MPTSEQKHSGDALPHPESAENRLEIGALSWSHTELADALLKARLTPAEHSLFRDYLWTLGFKTIKTFLREGTIVKKMMRIGHPFYFLYDDRRLLRESSDLRDELAAEVLILAVPFFFKHLGSWKPGRGASLTTYFIGACLINFREAYSVWTNARHEKWLTPADIDLASLLDPHNSAFTAQVEIHETVRQVIKLAKPGQRPIVELLYAGYSQVEIAEKLGLTPRAVEGKVYQLRKRVLLAVQAGKIAPPPGFTSNPDPTQAKGPVMI